MRRNINFNFSVTLFCYGLKILTDSWESHLSIRITHQERCHPGRQPIFIHFFTNTLKCLNGRLDWRVDRVTHLPRSPFCMPSGHIPRQVKSCFINAFSIIKLGIQRRLKSAENCLDCEGKYCGMLGYLCRAFKVGITHRGMLLRQQEI